MKVSMPELPQMPNLKMIFFDVDNTIVGGASPALPSLRFQEAVKEVQKKGIKVSLATGRQPQKSLPIIEACQMNGWSVLTNGGQVYDGTKKEFITDYALPTEAVNLIVAKLESVGIDLWIQDDGVDHFWLGRFDEDGEGVYGVGKTLWSTEPSIEIGRYKVNRPYMIVARGLTSAQKENLLAWNEDYMPENVTVAVLHEYRNPGEPSNFEVMFADKRSTKRDGVELIVNQFGGADCVMVVGDSHNDITVMEYVGYPVAVENAVDEVLRVAGLIIPSWEDEGPALLLEALVQQRS